MNSLRNDVHSLFVNMHVRIKIYWKFYQVITYIANEGRHVRISNNYLMLYMLDRLETLI